jgi:ABC-type nitrate/sulfonate/bicarbonate transport system permease component
MTDGGWPRLVQFGFLLAVGIAWQLAGSAHAVSPLLLPPLGAVWAQLIALVASGGIWPDLRVTLSEVAIAFVLAAVLGCGIGYAVSRSRYAVRVFDPLLAALYAVPSILLFPLFVLFFGIGPGSKIALAASIAFFPIVLSTIAAFANVSPTLLAAARSMGASTWQIFASVMLPASFPVMLSGLRLGLVIALLSTLGGETISSFAGVGHQIVAFAENLETAQMYAWVLVALVLAFALNAVASLLAQRGAAFVE